MIINNGIYPDAEITALETVVTALNNTVNRLAMNDENAATRNAELQTALDAVAAKVDSAKTGINEQINTLKDSKLANGRWVKSVEISPNGTTVLTESTTRKVAYIQLDGAATIHAKTGLRVEPGIYEEANQGNITLYAVGEANVKATILVEIF